jgi:hypothetical protein
MYGERNTSPCTQSLETLSFKDKCTIYPFNDKQKELLTFVRRLLAGKQDPEQLLAMAQCKY